MKLITVKTIAKRHVEQLPPEHYWDGEYNWKGKTILGRIAGCGFLLVKDSGGLHRIAPIAYIDGQLEQNGCRKRGANGQWVYAPTPHTEYSRKAQADYHRIPQIFVD